MAEGGGRSVAMALSSVLKYLVVVPKGLAQIISMSCLIPCATKALGSAKVRDIVRSRQDPQLSQRSRDRLLSSIEGSLEFANTKEKSKAIWERTMQEVNMTAELGGRAPNPLVMRLEDRTQCHLLDLARKARPLVLNFGSCT
ncbi:uncharacterized protein [Panulirus ornatus]